MPKGVYPHPKHSAEQKAKISASVSALWSVKRRGKSYAEIFGKQKSKSIRKNQAVAKNKNWSDPSYRNHMSRAHIGKTGENASHWKGGVTSLKKRLRSTLKWKQWRSKIYERDNYTCQECLVKGGKLEPHHIIPLMETLSRAFDVGNGITLCRPCHLKTIRKEKLFADKYFSILKNKFPK